MHEKRQSFLIGVVSIVAVAGLGLLLFLFGELDGILVDSYRVTLHTDNAAGLRRGSTVLLNGVRVGQVGSVSVSTSGADPDRSVRIEAQIEKAQPIPEGVDIMIERSLLGGSAVLAFYGASGAALPQDDRAELSMSYVSSLEKAVEEHLAPLRGAVGSFEQMAVQFAGLGERLNTLLAEPADPPDPDAAPSLLDTVARVNTLVGETTEAMVAARRWLDDEDLRAEISGVAASATTALDETAGTMRRYGELADSLETDVERLMARLTTVSDQAGAALEEIRRLTLVAAEGDGTVARLMTDPELYLSLTDSAKQLEKLLAEAKLLIGKVMAEGVPIRY